MTEQINTQAALSTADALKALKTKMQQSKLSATGDKDITLSKDTFDQDRDVIASPRTFSTFL